MTGSLETRTELLENYVEENLSVIQLPTYVKLGPLW